MDVALTYLGNLGSDAMIDNPSTAVPLVEQ